MSTDTKVCTKCLQEKPKTEFSISDKKRGYHHAQCKVCTNARVREYYATNEEYRTKQKANIRRQQLLKPCAPEVTRKHSLKHKYNLTLEQYEGMKVAQGNKCALCGADDPGRTKLTGKWKAGHWNIDHCHTTGQVRGLLCHTCNVRVGAYERLMSEVGQDKVLEYLKFKE